MGNATNALLEDLKTAWRPLEDAVSAMTDDDWERATSSGWTAKEMLAHVGFWDEAAVPVITYMLRGQDIPKRDWFESGFRPPEDRDWPPAYEHNAREAEWGREHSSGEVRGRLMRAHEAMTAAAGTIADDEASQRAGYIQDQCAHYREHLAELRPLLER
ncbi:MAG: DinB family protein [Dehalococcoidia bacterium]